MNCKHRVGFKNYFKSIVRRKIFQFATGKGRTLVSAEGVPNLPPVRRPFANGTWISSGHRLEANISSIFLQVRSLEKFPLSKFCWYHLSLWSMAASYQYLVSIYIFLRYPGAFFPMSLLLINMCFRPSVKYFTLCRFFFLLSLFTWVSNNNFQSPFTATKTQHNSNSRLCSQGLIRTAAESSP